MHLVNCIEEISVEIHTAHLSVAQQPNMPILCGVNDSLDDILTRPDFSGLRSFTVNILHVEEIDLASTSRQFSAKFPLTHDKGILNVRRVTGQ